MVGGLLRAGDVCADDPFTEGLVEFGGPFLIYCGYSGERDKDVRVWLKPGL